MSPRNKRNRRIVSPPLIKGFQPIGHQDKKTEEIRILFEEYEAQRLVDYSYMKQEDAAKLMEVSRPTFTRIYNSCLKKIARAFAEGRPIKIEGGHVEFDKDWYRCGVCETVFHQAEKAEKECVVCESGDLEHINESIRNWNDKNGKAKENN